MCKSDGTCGTYYSNDYNKMRHIFIIFYQQYLIFLFIFGISILLACQDNGADGDGTTEGSCTTGQQCNADGTCGM